MSLVLRSFLTLLAAIHVGHERPVSVARTGVPARVWSETSRISSNGNGFLVGWTDFRADLPVHGNEENPAGEVIRIDAAGRVLDEYPIGVPVTHFSTVWAGTYWLVFDTGGYVWVSPDGTLLDQKRQLFSEFIPGFDPRAVWTGSAILVSAYDSSLTRIVIRALDPVTLGVLRQQTYSAGLDSVLAFATNGRTALLLYRPSQVNIQVYGAMFDGEGRELWHRQLISSSNLGASVALASAGTDFLMMLREPNTAGTIYRGYWIRPLGDVATATGTFGFTNRNGPRPAGMTWDGTKYTYYFWTEFDVSGQGLPNLWAMRIAPSGALLDTTPVHALNQDQAIATRSLNAAALPGLVALVYEKRTASFDTDLRVRIAGDPLMTETAPEHDPVRGAFAQETPVAASAAVNSIVAWRERVTPDGPLTLYATRVDPAGTVLDPDSILISPTTCDSFSPAVASDGSDFLVVWRDTRAFIGQLIRADGTHPAPFSIASSPIDCGAAPSIAWNGTDYLVAWTERRVIDTGNADAKAARVTRDGTLLNVFPVATSSSEATTTKVASDGDGFLIAWGRNAAHVTSEGTVDRMVFNPGTMRGVAWTGTSYVIATAESGTLHLRRVARDGTFVNMTDFSLFVPQQLAFRCTATECLAPFFDPAQDGSQPQELLRLTDNGTFTVEKVPVTTPADGASPPRSMQLFGANQLSLAYVRLPLQTPISGAPRVFIRAAPPIRTRSVRH